VLPVALTIYARPFGEPTLLRVASADERAYPEVRVPPPDFGPLPGEP
jgi:Asp-tRNA(Asn)/Glu-tRNA(Gln) amidotransferase A subunit family amidase